MSDRDLTGTTALVTGASRGFGRGIATALSRAGAQVVGVARDRGALEDLGAELGGSFTVVAADAADPVVAGQLIDTYRPATLVLNAGATPIPTSLHLLEPLGYLDFLSLEAGSSLVLTDSGGIQEETTVLGVPCLTLRDNTERPITIELGTNRLAGTKRDSILGSWREMLASPRRAQIPPLWDGQAGMRSREVLHKYYLGVMGVHRAAV